MQVQAISYRIAGALLLALASGGSALGQAAAVNECTLLTDPTQLQQCVERAKQNQGGRGPASFAPDAFSPRVMQGSPNKAAEPRRKTSEPGSGDKRGAGDPGPARSKIP